MKTSITCILLAAGISAATAEPAPSPYLSLQQEMKQAIARGNAYLKSKQKPDGFWDDEGLPAFTSLALTAAARDPNLDRAAPLPSHLAKGFDWLIKQQKPDGGIYNRGLSVYNTATAVSALAATGREEYEPAIVRARKHLINNQWGTNGKSDGKNDGGIGYGSKNDHTDLSNTYLAIEAIVQSQKIVADNKYGTQPDIDWKAALTFISRCQNLPGSNDQPFASDDPKNKGGFIYTPGESKAGEEKLPNGRTALRSYGSMSYAGLLSFIYAKLTPDDPRVAAVKEWLGKNYTVAENPGLGDEGLFYYYQVMAKALAAANIDKLPLANGSKADWRKDLAEKILAAQREDGSWLNSNGRWMESNSTLVTAYSLIALENLYNSIPTKP